MSVAKNPLILSRGAGNVLGHALASIFVMWLLMAGTIAAEVEEDVSTEITVLRMLENAGLPEKLAKEFFESLKKAEETNDLAPFARWLTHKDERIIFTAAASMFGIDPDEAEKRILKVAKAKANPSESIVLVLGMSQTKESIDFLIRQTAKAKDPVTDPAIAALQIRTGRSFIKSSEWTDWWKRERGHYESKLPPSPFEFAQRLQAVRVGNVFRGLGPVPKNAKNAKTVEALKSVGSIFEKIAAGQSMEISKETLRGVNHFCRGEFDEALASYESALKVDQFDRVALLDSACLLLEADRFEDAARALRRLDALIPGSKLIASLQKIAEEKVPKSGWLESMRLALAGHREWLSEPLLAFLFERAMSEAKLQIPQSTLEEILYDSSNSLSLQLGAALASLKAAQPPLMALVRTRFPDSPEVQAWCFLATVGNEQWKKEAADAGSRWAALEPDNLVPKVGLVALKVNRPKKGELTPIFRGQLLDELDEALAAPNRDFHLGPADDCVRQIIDETKFPFVAIAPDATGQIAGLTLKLARGVGVEKEHLPKRPEDVPAWARSQKTFASLTRQFPPEIFREGVAKVASTAMAAMVLDLERALAEIKGDAEAIKTLDQKKEELRRENNAFAKNPDTMLPLIPLPSLHHELLQAREERHP